MIPAILLFAVFSLGAWTPGETAYSFLDIPVSARTASMGGLSVLTGDPDIALYNPARLRDMKRSQIELTNILLFPGVSQQGFIYARKNLGLFYQTLGTKIEGRDEFGNLLNEEYAYQGSYAGAGISLKKMERMYWGIALKSVQEKRGEESSASLAADIVLNYNTFLFSVRNLGPGADMGGKYSLPAALHAGGEERMGRFRFLYEVVYRREKRLIYAAGLEFKKESISFRAGLRSAEIADNFFGIGL
ncbi:MAG TPA: hypothetical protein VJC03_02120, partial [bacterium]|nr:hypothetical protein [bacterium]